jgi:hypothetical protein
MSLEKASVAGNVVAVGPQAGKSFVKHRRHPFDGRLQLSFGPRPNKN